MSEHKTKVQKNNDSDFSHDGGHSLHFYRDVTLVLGMQLRINAKEVEKRHKNAAWVGNWRQNLDPQQLEEERRNDWMEKKNWRWI